LARRISSQTCKSSHFSLNEVGSRVEDKTVKDLDIATQRVIGR
jgi:hypothetical protein